MNMSVKRNRSFSSSRVAFAALGLSVLTACGGGQGGMKMGDNQFAVEAVKATSSNQSEQSIRQQLRVCRTSKSVLRYLA